MFNESSSTSAGLVVNTALESDETAGSLISPVIATITSALSLIPQIVSSPATITLLEDIPVRERDMDRIRARIVSKFYGRVVVGNDIIFSSPGQLATNVSGPGTVWTVQSVC